MKELLKIMVDDKLVIEFGKKKNDEFCIVGKKKYKIKKGVLDLSGKIKNYDLNLIGLDKLTNLKKLNLSNNQINKINFENKSNIEELDLGYNNITEINGLENLTDLMVLDLPRNQISEIKGLDNLTNLRKLGLGANKITEIKGLDNLTKLKILDLKKNSISTIKGLENLVSLNVIQFPGMIYDNTQGSSFDDVMAQNFVKACKTFKTTLLIECYSKWMCGGCGKKILSSSKSCPYCSALLKDSRNVPKPKMSSWDEMRYDLGFQRDMNRKFRLKYKE